MLWPVLARSGPQASSAPESVIEQQLQASPTAEGWQKLGLIRHLQNRFDAAIPAFRNAVRLQPSLWTSHLFLGICLYRTNDFPGALVSLARADTLAPAGQPGRDDVDFWLGAARIASKQTLVGLQSLERLLQRNPKHVDALELSVRTYAELNTTAWSAVAERHFDTAPGYEVHGHALAGEGDRDGALVAFRQSKTMAPQRAGPGLEIGKLLLLNGNAEEAWAVLQQEVGLRGANPEAHHYAALAAIRLGKHSEAAPLLETAAMWMPGSLDVALTLAQVYLALKQMEDAVRVAAQAVSLHPSSPAAHDLMVSAAVAAGRQNELKAEQQRWAQQRQKHD